jgi:ADP-dependent phosphofructokinase/glucokinase
MLTTLNYNHSEDTISDSIGLDENELLYSKLAIIFSVMSPRVLADELFDDDDEIPENMKSVSGCVELLMSLMKNEKMVVFSLLHFTQLYEKLSSGLALLNHKVNIDDLMESDDEKGKMDDIMKAVKNLALKVSLAPVKILVEHIKEANGDFNKFRDIIQEQLDSANNIGDIF